VLSSRLTASLTGLGLPPAAAATIASSTAHGDANTASAAAPAALQTQLHSIVAHDFAAATQAVLYGMAIAHAICFLVAERYPRQHHHTRTPA
jgi:hypothetical protein